MAASGDGAAAHHDLVWAHQQLLRDGALQFHFDQAPKPPPPGWIEHLIMAIARFIGWAFPFLKLVFWAGLIFAAAFILFAIGREIVSRKWGSGRKARPINLGAETWRPSAETARAVLGDADALAAEGRFADAVHALLFRSIDDIRSHRPHLVRPALTARDIAALEALPATARPAFARIAEVVERSFFGGRPVGAEDFAACRQDYQAFALQGAWT